MADAIFPPRIDDRVGIDSPAGVFRRKDDPAKLIVGIARYERPTLSLVNGGTFEWPIGVEGVTISGSAGLAEHHYIGDDDVVLQVLHRDDRHIAMSGMFPGLTGSANVRALLEIIKADTPEDGKLLTLPGIFLNEQVVVVSDYNFTHDEGDHNDSWIYTINFRKVNIGRKITRPKTTISPSNPDEEEKAEGKTPRVYTIKAGVRTLRAVARAVYKNENRWNEIYQKNQRFQGSQDSLHQLPTKPLPLGMKLNF
jgi:hypothetical protein